MTCALAAEGGHLEVLRWARDNGCDWDRHTCLHAASGGQLAALQWARAGVLEVLQWLHASGCLWDAKTCALAAEGATWPYSSGRGPRAAPGAPKRVPVLL